MPASPEPASPCIGVCQLRPDGVCRGCGRHVDEIAEWPYASPARKLAIIEAARDRVPPVSSRPPSP